MKKNVFIYPYIFLLAFNNFSLTKIHSNEINNLKKIPIEYLDQFSSNDYIIGPGDTVDIIISRDLRLSTRATVDGEGTIYVPKLERVYVNGLTINELNSLLNEAYLEFIKFPEVQSVISSYRPIRVFVDGEVVNPGLVTMEGSFLIESVNKLKNDNLTLFEKNNASPVNAYFPTVFDAIRASGGITRFSNLKSIQIIRNENISNGSGKKITTLNFENLLKFGDSSQNIRIYDSDIIKIKRNKEPNQNLLTKAIISGVNPKFINVFVFGRVNDPGSKNVSRVSVLSDAIDMAGGAKALRGPVTFLRFNSDGTIDKRKISYTKNQRGGFKNPNLRDGDLILVGDSFMSKTSEVIEEFTSPFVGIFSTYGLIKAISD